MAQIALYEGSANRLCRRMGLFEYWNVYGPPDNCELKDGKLICH